jgi:hypothetical protein
VVPVVVSNILRAVIRSACVSGLLLLFALPAGAGALVYEPEPPFCKPHVVRDHLAPLGRLPKLHGPGEGGRIGFGPRNLRLLTGPRLLVGGGRVGFALRLEQRRSLNLPWTAVTSLVPLSRKGRPLAPPRRKVERVGYLRAHGGDEFVFEVPDGYAIYRLMTVFRDAAGQKLGRFGTYYRVVDPVIWARLNLSALSFRAEQSVFARVENLGTQSAFYGVDFLIERLEGDTWQRAPESPTGPWILLGITTPGGMTGRCSRFWIPPTMPPGRYRMVKSARFPASDQKGWVERTLVAEFNVLPQMETRGR